MINFKKYSFLLFIVIHFNLFAQTGNLDSLLANLKSQKEDTNKVNTLREICANMRFKDPKTAIVYGKKCIELAQRLRWEKGLAGGNMRLGTAYNYASYLDSALVAVNNALSISHKISDTNLLANSYLNRADIYRQKANIKEALNDCFLGIKYAEKANNIEVKTRIYSTLGSIYLNQLQLETAEKYYNSALKSARKLGNKRIESGIINNLGLVYKHQKNYQKAIEITKKGIQLVDSLHDLNNLGLFNFNLSSNYFQINEFINAEKHANLAIKYGAELKNDQVIAKGNVAKANALIKLGKYYEALQATNIAIPIFKKSKNYSGIAFAAGTQAEVYAKLGEFEKAYISKEEASIATDSTITRNFKEELASLQTKFDVAEKDKEITLLSKAKELQAQKISRQRLLFSGVFLISILALVGLWQAYNRRNLKEKLHELELRNQIAADLHDEVGSSLSSINMLSQMVANQPNMAEKDKSILEKMTQNSKETMEKMSDIVWMIKPGDNDTSGLCERMKHFLREITETKNIDFTFKTEGLETVNLDMAQRKNIYLIFKEAVNNAVKYSATKSIEVSFQNADKQLIMNILDHGNGFDIEKIRRGNGLENMQNRAKELGALFDITSQIDKGTTINLKLKI